MSFLIKLYDYSLQITRTKNSTLNRLDSIPQIVFWRSSKEKDILQFKNSKRLKNIKQSAISDSLLQCNYTINFDNFDILAAESNKLKLLLRESLLIKRDKPILSRTIKSFPLELFD